jgi:hypothetical protein
MEEAKKAVTSPASVSVAPASPSPAAAIPGSGGSQIAAPTKRRQRLPGDPEKGLTSPKSRARKDANELKFEAIRVLSNLVEGGKFFLLVETPDGKKDTVNCWN